MPSNQKEIKKKSVVHRRFLVSFGAWNLLSYFMKTIDFLKLQALNHFTYDVGISRVLPTFYLREELYALNYATFRDFQQHHVIWRNSRHDWQCEKYQSLRIDLQNAQTIVVLNRLFAFHTKADRVRVTKFDFMSRVMQAVDYPSIPHSAPI